MARTDFEKLDVYRLSEQLADEVWELVSGWFRFAKWTVGKQIDRLRPLVDELAPRLNAYLNSIGKGATDR